MGNQNIRKFNIHLTSREIFPLETIQDNDYIAYVQKALQWKKKENLILNGISLNGSDITERENFEQTLNKNCIDENIKIQKIEEQQIQENSPIEFLLEVVPQQHRNEIKLIIEKALDAYLRKNSQNAIWSLKSCLINCIYPDCCCQGNEKCCCRQVAPLIVSDFQKSKNCLFESRFYGNLLFDKQDGTNFISIYLKNNDLRILKNILDFSDIVFLIKYLIQNNNEILLKKIFDTISDNQDEINNQNNYTTLKQIIKYEDINQLKQILNYNELQRQLNIHDSEFEDLNSGFSFGKRCGFGISTNKDELYIGEFFNNKYHGKGKLINFSNLKLNNIAQTFFAGKVKSQLVKNQEITRNQNQVFQNYQGGQFKGHEQNPKFNGFAVVSFINGNQYEGQWKQGKMHGTGQFTWINGDEYLGEYYEGKKYGFGKYEGMKQGFGKYDSLNKIQQYIGQFRNGQYHGIGMIKRKHSQYIEAWWNDGLQY